MSIGSSGRIVIEIDPSLKRELHSALARQGVTLKDWFVAYVAEYLQSYRQPSLHLADREGTPMQEDERGL